MSLLRKIKIINALKGQKTKETAAEAADVEDVTEPEEVMETAEPEETDEVAEAVEIEEPVAAEEDVGEEETTIPRSTHVPKEDMTIMETNYDKICYRAFCSDFRESMSEDKRAECEALLELLKVELEKGLESDICFDAVVNIFRGRVAGIASMIKNLVCNQDPVGEIVYSDFESGEEMHEVIFLGSPVHRDLLDSLNRLMEIGEQHTNSAERDSDNAEVSLVREELHFKHYEDLKKQRLLLGVVDKLIETRDKAIAAHKKMESTLNVFSKVECEKLSGYLQDLQNVADDGAQYIDYVQDDNFFYGKGLGVLDDIVNAQRGIVETFHKCCEAYKELRKSDVKTIGDAFAQINLEETISVSETVYGLVNGKLQSVSIESIEGVAVVTLRAVEELLEDGKEVKSFTLELFKNNSFVDSDTAAVMIIDDGHPVPLVREMAASKIALGRGIYLSQNAYDRLRSKK